MRDCFIPQDHKYSLREIGTMIKEAVLRGMNAVGISFFFCALLSW